MTIFKGVYPETWEISPVPYLKKAVLRVAENKRPRLCQASADCMTGRYEARYKGNCIGKKMVSYIEERWKRRLVRSLSACIVSRKWENRLKRPHGEKEGIRIKNCDNETQEET
jgi:hypothetical protein